MRRIRGRAAPLAAITLAVAGLLAGARAGAADETRVSYDDAVRAAQRAAPDVLVAGARQRVAQSEVRVAGVLPNPSASVGTSTQTAKISAGVSVPLVVLGQRGAAIDAARADATTVALDARVTWNDVRQSTEKAFAALWLAEGVAGARREAAALATALENAVAARVQVGSAPEIDALRVHAERLRADADAADAAAQVDATASELARWMGTAVDGAPLRARGEPFAPDALPALPALVERVGGSAPAQREEADARAAAARAQRERAAARPTLTLDLGVDAYDPTVPATNYRAQLALEVPILHQRGAYVERELALGDVARARAAAVKIQLTADLRGAYRTFEAATTRRRAFETAIVPGAQAAAKATEEAYGLGRATLLAVLDAQRTLLDARVSALEAVAARANAWSDIEHALGAP